MDNNNGSASGSAAPSAAPSPLLSYIPFVLVLLFAVYCVAYYVWPTAANSSVVAMGPYELHGSSMVLYPPIQLIDIASSSKSFANNFTFSTYIYISDLTKPLMIGQQPPNPLITMRNAATISVDAQNSTAQIALEPTNSPGTLRPMSLVTVPNFMAARWNQLLFTIEGRTVDVYLNGALVTSTLLENVPLAAPLDITLNVQPGFDGQLGYTQAWPRRLTMPEVLSNYKKTSDYKGKPTIPDTPFKWADVFRYIQGGLCAIGICADEGSPLEQINYQY
jgi:hypothetical protein